MTKCCDAHDICYDTCNTDKERCDVEFRRCLYKFCDGYESNGIVNTCKAAAKMLFTGTMTLGCKSYLNSQSQACYCENEANKSNNKKSKKYTKGAGEL